LDLIRCRLRSIHYTDESPILCSKQHILKCDKSLYIYLLMYSFKMNIEKRYCTFVQYLFMYDPYGIRTRDTAVKGRCLNRLTKGPKIMAEKEGFEPSHRFRDLHP